MTSPDLRALDGATRLVVRADLQPVIGSTFQPTGFANLGAALFERPGTEGRLLLVESVQSMANHLEGVGWDDARQAPVEALAGLPYLEVRGLDGAYLTSSRTEPHRLAAGFVRDAEIADQKGIAWLAERLGLEAGKPLAWPDIYAAILALDPLSLVHGVFFSDRGFPGNPKVRRAITAVIEAHDVREVVSGGVKRDDVLQRVKSESGERVEGQGAEEGYGFIPFARTEYAARRIELSAVVDLEQLRGYGLDAPHARVLRAITLWELRSLLEGSLRLRTACDLELVGDVRVGRPDGFVLPSLSDLTAELADARGAAGYDAIEPVGLTWSPKKGKAAT